MPGREAGTKQDDTVSGFPAYAAHLLFDLVEGRVVAKVGTGLHRDQTAREGGAHSRYRTLCGAYRNLCSEKLRRQRSGVGHQYGRYAGLLQMMQAGPVAYAYRIGSSQLAQDLATHFR